MTAVKNFLRVMCTMNKDEGRDVEECSKEENTSHKTEDAIGGRAGLAGDNW